MSYSFVRLYLSKCNVCVLNHIWINLKRFLIIFICFWKWFLSLFVFMFSAYFVFHCLNMFCFEKQVSEFLATHFGYSFWWLASRESKPQVHTKGFRDSLATQFATRQLRNAQIQLFKELFRGKLILNLFYPLLNPSFNIFTSKPNQFE